MCIQKLTSGLVLLLHISFKSSKKYSPDHDLYYIFYAQQNMCSFYFTLHFAYYVLSISLRSFFTLYLCFIFQFVYDLIALLLLYDPSMLYFATLLFFVAFNFTCAPRAPFILRSIYALFRCDSFSVVSLNFMCAPFYALSMFYFPVLPNCVTYSLSN